MQHPFMITMPNKLGIEGEYLNIMKLTFNKPTANIILNVGKPKAFSTVSETNQGCLLLPFFTETSSGSPS
jgi:hypothetical protein